MTDGVPEEIRQRLEHFGQQHVLQWWSELNSGERSRLLAQLATIEFESLQSLWKAARTDSANPKESLASQALRATPPSCVVRIGENLTSQELDRATKRGNGILSAGRVGVVLVAGGEGTRLQFPHAKGLYPIGPVTGRTLYHWLFEQIAERSRRAGVQLPVYVMTSDATHDETVRSFEEFHGFGMSRENVRFFRQGTMPVLDLAHGSLLMASRSQICVGPDGHGGLVRALARENLVDDMLSRGLTDLFYMQVDNPNVIVCDPAFLGFHEQHESELSTKVVAKRSSSERMGVLCEVDGITQIIEYSDMPNDVAGRTDASGRLLHWAGNTAIHLFAVELLRRLTRGEAELPLHIARKHVPYLSRSGEAVQPTPQSGPPNACKFEKFIFDALPLAKRTLVVETDRSREFNPLKDRDGENNPAAVRSGLSRMFAGWLRKAGVPVSDGVAVEIAPGFALDDADLANRTPVEIRERMREVQTESGSAILLE